MGTIIAALVSTLLVLAFYSYCGVAASPLTDENASSKAKDRIAIVEPTFTYAAYQNGSFYNFYVKYGKTPRGVDVTTDLDFLSGSVIPTGPFIHYKAPEKGPTIPHSVFHRHAEEHVRAFAPEANITKIGDQHVHQGLVFNQNGSNAYDLLVLFHNEYLSQTEYDNLRRFVENGGTILFTMGNILYAEVAYDQASNSIALVKGHDWEFDGKAARKSVSERWAEESRQWVGGNFMKIPTRVNVQFANNPFNYTHIEEQYVANPNARILVDYGANYAADPAFNFTVATYEMKYGSGKVVVIGLFANSLISNVAFWNFFDDIILPHSILPTFDRATLFQSAAGEDSPIYVKMSTGSIKEMIADNRFKSIHISLERTSAVDDVFTILLSKDLLPEASTGLEVWVNDATVTYEITECDSEISLAIPLHGKADQIKISYPDAPELAA